MQVAEYFSEIEELAKHLNDKEESACNLIEQPGAKADLITALIQFRYSQMTASDRNKVQGYLVIGHFRDRDTQARPAAFLVCFELEQAMAFDRLRRETELYDIDHPLFKKAPTLLDKIRKRKRCQGELIDAHSLKLNDSFSSRLTKYKNHYSLITYYLDPFLAYWVSSNFPRCPLFIRLNPYKVSGNTIPELLFSSSRKQYSITMEYDKLIDFVVNNLMGCNKKYDLRNDENKDDASAWSIRVDKIARLEISVTFKKEDSYLSFMAEEIEEYAANDSEYPYLLGRMIHVMLR